jgi:rare lipoprotein A
LAAFRFIFRGARNNKGKRTHMNVVTRTTGALFGLVLAALTLGAPAEARTGHSGFHARGHHTHFTRHAHSHHRIHSVHTRRHHASRSARRAHHASGGNASWYGPGFQGHRTASGERFNSGGFTAAHRSLPFGTRVRVTNNATGRSVVVRINDRGPFVRGRQIDLAAGAARAIGMSGTSYVSMSVVR